MGEAEIINMKERLGLNERGEAVKMIVVTYRLPNGYEGELEIPKSEFNETELKKRLREEASKVESLLGKKVIF